MNEDADRAYARRLLARRTGRNLEEIAEAEISTEVTAVETYGALLDSPITHDEAARLAWPAA